MQISTTGRTRSPIAIIYGPHKIGKSTFGANCPDPIFLRTEDGLEGITTQALDLCEDYGMVKDQLIWILEGEHKFKTLVIDSIDWLEALIFKFVIAKFNWTEINPENSFGRGYLAAETEWREIVRLIREINLKRKMFICMLGHAKLEKFEDPERPNFDRWSLDLQKRGASLLSEFADVIGFCTQEVEVKESKEKFGAKDKKAKSSGERILKLGKSPTYEAGNRYGLPDELPLDVDAFMVAMKECAPSVKDLAKVNSEKNNEYLQKGVKSKSNAKGSKKKSTSEVEENPEGAESGASN